MYIYVYICIYFHICIYKRGKLCEKKEQKINNKKLIKVRQINVYIRSRISSVCIVSKEYQNFINMKRNYDQRYIIVIAIMNNYSENALTAQSTLL